MKQNRQIRKQKRLIPVATVCFALLGLGLGTVRGQDSSVSFKRDVAPIFLENCVACHDERRRVRVTTSPSRVAAWLIAALRM